MSNMRPAFLITIDTEADNLWARGREVTLRNADYLPRFQGLCERFGFKPTYLTDWDMAHCPSFREFARDLLARDAGEIGMHLHAWSSPPLRPLTSDDVVNHPYLVEFPESQIREKVSVLTDELEQTFGVKMLSHRAGRWAFNEIYARVLIEHGYRVDCSVTPHMSWKSYKGDPRGQGGTDYSNFPETAYFVDPQDISRAGRSPLLEVPVTVMRPRYSPVARLCRSTLGSMGRLGQRLSEHLYPTYGRLIPNGCNRGSMLAVVEEAHRQNRPHIEFMLHSSEFMPGGSPSFPDHVSIERLYDDLEALFARVSRCFSGRTLSEFHREFCVRSPLPVSAAPRPLSLACSPAQPQV